MEFEIDVSGEDILSHNYSIVVASNDIVKGFKLNRKLIQILRSRQGERKYRYALSVRGKSLLKVRLYCIIVYYIFKSINLEAHEEIVINVCRDFYGHEREINSHLKYFLQGLLGLNISLRYVHLPKGSKADRYAGLLRRDKKNQMECYVDIGLEDIEKFLIRL